MPLKWYVLIRCYLELLIRFLFIFIYLFIYLFIYFLYSNTSNTPLAMAPYQITISLMQYRHLMHPYFILMQFRQMV